MTDYDHIMVMCKLACAAELMDDLRCIIGSCSALLHRDDPMYSVLESLGKILYYGGAFPCEALDSDKCLNLRLLASKAVEAGKEIAR